MKKSTLSVFFLVCVLTTGLWSGLASAATNIAQGKTTFASSVKNNSQAPEWAVDGDYNSRWSSDHGDNEWITVDLGERYDLTEARLYWHNAYAEDYEVQVSDDGNSWTVVKSVIDNDGGLDELSLSGQGRYVRIELFRPGTKRGYSLLELEVYGEPVMDDTDTSADDTDTSTGDTDTSADDTDTSADDTDTSTDDTDTSTGDTDTSTDDTDTSTDDTDTSTDDTDTSTDDTDTSTDVSGTSTDDTNTSTDDTGTTTDDTGASMDNLALHKTASASSVENDYLGPEQAIDGDPDTRWSSDFSDHNWITVDLQARYELTEIKLYWQNSYSKDYDVKVSDDGIVWHTVESVIDSDGGLDQLQIAGGKGRFVRIEGYRRATRWGHSLWELEVYGHPVVENISHNKPVSASSMENNSLAPEYAVDGDSTTRWSSQFTDNEWFEVDFGAEHQVTQVKLFWQNSYSKDYEIQTSYDGQSWVTLRSEENSDGGLDDLMVQGHGRYLRVKGSRRATQWGHSLWEMEVYGYATPDSANNEEQDAGQDDSGSTDDTSTPDDDGSQTPEDTQAPTVPTGLVAAELVGPAVSLVWEAATDNVDVLSYEIYRDDVRLTELMAPVTTFQDDAVEAGATYRYAVRSVDAAGNTSPLSTEALITLESQGESTVVGGSVRLEWLTPDQRENGDYLELDEIGGYELRYREEGQSEAEVVTIEGSSVTSYTFEELSGSYQFSIAVYDTNGLYSEFVQLEPVQN